MNTATSLFPPGGLDHSANSPKDSSGASDFRAENEVRNRLLFQKAAKTVEQLREMSLKAIKQAGPLAGQAGQATLDTLRAIWELIMSIMRWLARVFGFKAGDREAAVDGVPSAKKTLAPEDAVAADAKELIDTMAEAQSAPGDVASAFAKSLEYAGLAGLDACLLDHVKNPDVFKSAKAPADMFLAALTKADAAIKAVESQLFEANMGRAAAANALDENFTPPVNVEDMVKLYRSSAFKPDSVSPQLLEQINALIAADDKLLAVFGHKNLIRETMLAITASAVRANVDVDQHPGMLTSVLGGDWESKLSAIRTEMAALAVPSLEILPSAGLAPASASNGVANAQEADSVYRDMLSRLGKGPTSSAPENLPAKAAHNASAAPVEPALPVQDPAQQAADFMGADAASSKSAWDSLRSRASSQGAIEQPAADAIGGDAASVKPSELSARDRLRLASQNALQFPPPPDDFMGDTTFPVDSNPN